MYGSNNGGQDAQTDQGQQRGPCGVSREEGHFDADPDDLNWGHVGILEFYATQLRRITDMAFKEGEHAE
jgi:hypothetical protein